MGLAAKNATKRASKRASKKKAVVQEALANLDIRQLHREAARAMLNRVKQLYKARREGRLNEITEAIAYCKSVGLMGMVEPYYGIQILHTSAGVTLAFGPDGRAAWRMLPPISALRDTPENLEFCF